MEIRILFLESRKLLKIDLIKKLDQMVWLSAFKIHVKVVFKNLCRLFGKYSVAEHDDLVKSTTKIFSNFVAFSKNPNFNKCQRKQPQDCSKSPLVDLVTNTYYILESNLIYDCPPGLQLQRSVGPCHMQLVRSFK